MKNNFGHFFRNLIGLKIYIAIFCLIILPIITLYQLIISLFIPCFYNVLILLIQYLLLVTLWFWIFFC